ncbi:shikimate kinase [Gordonia sp. PDNC005]|uniref:shikimate kinase n=1 Tax=unclassified Gordonia (in: high G+C Gram-positive bacteria) TaxID=2657482 RepID=UPI001964C150|nr:shikimate kinase [Gordonia sp. PDNC005]QRY64019.1 shikimate kinase [Gordonia sp. PDNC005]
MTVVVLAGFMGSGKSTVGRAVADRLGLRFVDTDIEIERRSGRTIPEIFDADGETGFRSIEADVVRAVLSESTGVVALGGGSPTVQAISDVLAGHHVVYLAIGADDGFERVKGSNRPLLSSPEPSARYAELLNSRVDAYESVARFTVDATRPVDEIVTDIIRSLHEAGLPQEDS